MSFLLQVYLPIIANIVIIISVIVSILVPLFSARLNAKRQKSNIQIEEIEDKGIEADVYRNIYHRTIGVSYKQLKTLYMNTHQQSNSWFIFSGVVASVGILVIVTVFIIPSYTLFYSIAIPLITALGIILELIAIFSFYQARQKNKAIDAYCSMKFLEADEISQLIYLIASNPDPETRDRFKEKIISQILIPMNIEEVTSLKK